MSQFRDSLSQRSLLRVIAALAFIFFLVTSAAASARAQTVVPSAPLAGATQVAVGSDFACALLGDGTIYCWGRGFDGQLGDGNRLDSLEPVLALGVEDAVKISAGRKHACALRANGRTSCWGYNVGALLGGAVGEIVAAPVDIPWAASAIDVSAEDLNTCILLQSGKVRCWEPWNLRNAVRLESPGIFPGAVALEGNQRYGCVLMLNGDVNCWNGQDIQLGPNGDSPRRREYTLRPKVVENAESLAMGGGRSCATVNSTLWCWDGGWSMDYATEDPEDAIFYDEPVFMQGVEDVAEVALGSSLCARTSDGQIYCKSFINTGVPPTQEEIERFRQIPQIDDATSLAAGLASACAVVDAAGAWHVKCFGYNGAGQLGSGSSTSVDIPALVEGTQGAQSLALAGNTSCALLENGRTACWGFPSDPAWNESVRQATYTATVQSMLAPAVAVGGFEPLVSGYPFGSLFPPTLAPYQPPNRICVAHQDATFSCAGESLVLSFDDISVNPAPPRPITETTPMVRDVVQLAVGDEHQCALTRQGEVYCFGRNQWGQTGIDLRHEWEGQTGDAPLLDIGLPQLVLGMTDVVDLSAADVSTCAVKRDGSLWCWGAIFVADGDFTPYQGYVARPEPSQILATGARRVSVNRFNTCAAMGEQGALCWGMNENGLLGVAEDGWIPPTKIEGQDVVEDVAVGTHQSCFLSKGEVWCVGTTTQRAVLDDGATRRSFSAQPFQIALTGTALAIEAGNGVMCALVEIDEQTQVACWGWNDVGQAGANPGWTPVEVRLGTPLEGK